MQARRGFAGARASRHPLASPRAASRGARLAPRAQGGSGKGWDPLQFAKTVLFFSPLEKVGRRVADAVFGKREPAAKDPSPGVADPSSGPPAMAELLFDCPGEPASPGVVLVTGATGGVGARVVRRLLSKGLRVRALVRDADRARSMFKAEDLAPLASPGARLDLVCADIAQPKTLLAAHLAGVDRVVSCSAARVVPREGDTPDRQKYYQGIKFYDPVIEADTPEAVDLNGLANVAKAFKRDGAAAAEQDLPAGQWQWGSLDDVVMGGVSASSAEMGEGVVFKGVVREQNNGGFCSLRTKDLEPPLDLAAFQGIRMRVQGDGQRYKLFLRTEPGFDAVGYSASFDAKQGEQVIDLPFSSFQPVFRAKTLQPGECAPLDPGKILSLQLMLSKFEYDGKLNPSFRAGPFRLPVSAISGYHGGSGEDAAPLFVHVSSCGVTRVDRPGIDLEAQPPAVRMNDALGGIMTYKLAGEDALRASGVPCAVVRPCALVEEPYGAELVVGQGDSMTGKVSREDVADLCCALLETPGAAGLTFEIKSTVPFSEPFAPEEPVAWRTNEQWAELIGGLRKGVTGKTVGGVYTGDMPEQEALEQARQDVSA